MVHNQVLERLRAAGALRAQAGELTQEARRILDKEVPRARKAGVPVAEIAELAGVSRRAVYDLLDRQ